MERPKNWSLVWSLYESIMEEIELGEWMDDFTGYETMLPSAGGGGSLMTVSGSSGGDSVKSRKSFEVYWCKMFQSGACDQGSPHMAQIKPDEPAVPVLHICAYCWTNFKKHKDHMECDCAAKK